MEGVRVRRLAAIALSYQISRERKALLDLYSPMWFNLLEEHILRGADGEHLGVAFPVGEVIDRLVRMCFESKEWFDKFDMMETEATRNAQIHGQVVLGAGYDGESEGWSRGGGPSPAHGCAGAGRGVLMAVQAQPMECPHAALSLTSCPHPAAITRRSPPWPETWYDARRRHLPEPRRSIISL